MPTDTTNVTTRLRAVLVVLAAVVIVWLSFGPIVAHFAAGRIRAVAAARGLTVSWRKLTVSGLGWVRLPDGTFINPADGGCSGSPETIERWKGWLSKGYTSNVEAQQAK